MASTTTLLSDWSREPENAARWEAFALHYGPMIKAWWCKEGYQDADALDLTQELLIKIREEVPRFRRRETSAHAWVRRVARNFVIDHHRRQSLRVRVPGRGGDDGWLQTAEAKG